MAEPSPAITLPETQANPQPAVGQATIDAPSFNSAGTQLELEARSVKNIDQAWNICKMLEVNNKQRALRTADLQALHDGQPPRSATDNAARGRSWQSNASTGWLAGITGRVAQRFVSAAISQLYETSSSLPTGIPDWKTKSDILRAKFTNLVRSWDGNTGLINSLATENCFQGYTYAVFLDPYTWKPTMFKQDRAFVPEMSGQHARDLQFFCAKMDYRLDEFLDLFKDEDAAKEVGYDVENCMYAANHAKMQDPREDALTTRFRSFVEMQNEGILGLTYTSSGARCVGTWLLFNREYDGQVSFWLIDRDSGKLLRFSFKLFKRMEDVIAMFSFEPGDGAIHSSKGLGRKLANLAIIKELFRNGQLDQARMSSLLLLQMDAKDKTKFAPIVQAPFVVVDKSVTVSQQQFAVNAESFKTMDIQIDAWAEQSVGAWLPMQLDSSGKTEKTATEASIDAKRESESADIMIRRWLDQFANLRQIQQLRVCSDDNIAEARRIYGIIQQAPELDSPELYEASSVIDAGPLRMLVEVMQEGITDDEIKLWRRSPASALAHVGESAVTQGVLAARQRFLNNPNVDQPALDFSELEVLVGAEKAKQLFIPQADQTIVAEASRLQLMESNTMLTTLIPVPVSPRDNHIVHGTTVQQLLTTVAAPALSQANAPESTLKAAELNLNHLGEHLAEATKLGQNKTPQFKEIEKFYQQFKQQLAQVVQIRAQAQVQQAMLQDQMRSGVMPQAEIPEQTQPTSTATELPTAPSVGEATTTNGVPE